MIISGNQLHRLIADTAFFSCIYTCEHGIIATAGFSTDCMRSCTIQLELSIVSNDRSLRQMMLGHFDARTIGSLPQIGEPYVKAKLQVGYSGNFRARADNKITFSRTPVGGSVG